MALDTRPASVAGMFYPATAGELRRLVEECFASPLGPGALPQVADRAPSRVAGLIAPHAGLVYSGPAAAYGYAALAEDGRPSTVVLLGPNHRGLGASIAVSASTRWATPLGSVPVDQEMAADFLRACPGARLDDSAHRDEHSLEVQLPFLQLLYGDSLKILPIVLSGEAYPSAQQIAPALVQAMREREAVVVASTDLSHYVPESFAAEQDRHALAAIQVLDAQGFQDAVADYGITLCGEGPVAATLAAARDLGAVVARLNTYYSSGAVTGDREQVVTYASLSLLRSA